MNRIFLAPLTAALLLTPAAGGMADTPAAGSSSGIIALNSLPNPPTALATAKVADAKGTMVGGVQKVVMDAAGKPVSVDITLLGTGAVVAIDASKFNYDQGHNVLMAQLDAQQIAAAPLAPPG
jgi:hypothetical protein